MTIGIQDNSRVLTRSTNYPSNGAAPANLQCTDSTGATRAGHCYRVRFEKDDPIFVAVMPDDAFRPRVSVVAANRAPVSMPHGTFTTTFASSSQPGEPVAFGGETVVAPQSGDYFIKIDTFSQTSGKYALFLPGTRIFESVTIDLGEIGGDDYLHANSELPAGVSAEDIKKDPSLAPVRRMLIDGKADFDVQVSADMLAGFNQLGRPQLEISGDHVGSVTRTLDLERQAGYSRQTIDAGLLYAALSGTIFADEDVPWNEVDFLVRFRNASGGLIGEQSGVHQGFIFQTSTDWDGAPKNVSICAAIPAGTRFVDFRLDVDAAHESQVHLSDATMYIRNNDPLLKLGVRTSWDIDFESQGVAKPEDIANSVSLAQSEIFFDNVQLNVAEVIVQFAKPVIEELKAATAVIRDARAALGKPIFPEGSYLRRLFGDRSLIELVFGKVETDTKIDDFFETLDAISEVSPTTAGAGYISVGGFRAATNNYDPLKPPSSTNDPRQVTISLYEDNTDNVETEFNQRASDFAFKIGKISSENGNFSIDILRNAERFADLLLPSRPPVTIVAYDMPRFDITHRLDQSDQLNLWQWLFPIQLAGSLRLAADFRFGYDNIDGPFLYTTPGVPEFEIDGFVGVSTPTFSIADTIEKEIREKSKVCLTKELGVCIDFGWVWEWVTKLIDVVGSAGLQGGLRFDGEFSLSDRVGNDGKVYLREMQQSGQYRKNVDLATIANYDNDQSLDPFVTATSATLHCAFDFEGDFGGVIQAFYKWPEPVNEYKTIDLATIQFYSTRDFNDFHSKLSSFAQITLAACGEDPPILGEVDPNGTLRLNMGTRAGLRRNVNTVDGDESFSVTARATSGVVEVTFGPFTQVFGAVDAPVKDVYANGGFGNDTILVDPSFPYRVEFWGGQGDDTLQGGALIDDLRGGSGQDKLFGNDGNDELYGDSNSDELHGGAGEDRLYGGDSNDLLYGDSENDHLYGESGADTLEGGGGTDRLFGGTDNDRLRGQAGGDYLFGGSGGDTLEGGAGVDELSGDEGRDFLYGHAAPNSEETSDDNAADTLNGGTDNDVLWGGGGDDTLDEGPGIGELHGGRGLDKLQGGTGDDVLYGDEDADTLEGGTGRDVLRGGSGDDKLFGNAENSTTADDFRNELYGEGGTDQLWGTEGDESFEGGDADDTIHTGNGRNEVLGGSGLDTIFGGEEKDIVDAGPQNDIVYGRGGDDELTGGSGVDTIEGGSGDDLIWGGTEGDILSGDQGIDTIEGQGGDDTIYGHAAATTSDDGSADILNGGTGRDIIRGGGGVDAIQGGDHDDRIYGDAGSDTIDGGTGLDIIEGGAGADRIQGGPDRDIIYGYAEVPSGDDNSADTIQGGTGDDDLFGQGGSDILSGGAGVDRIYGHSNDPLGEDNATDVILGGAQTDTLFGNGGKDCIVGGSGVDTISGGGGGRRHSWRLAPRILRLDLHCQRDSCGPAPRCVSR